MSYEAVSFYDKATGHFTGRTLRCTAQGAAALGATAGPGEGFVYGLHDPLSVKVDLATGKVVDYQPPSPSSDHAWDAMAKRWRLNPDAEARAMRRSAALVKITALESQAARPLRELMLDPTGATEARRRLGEIEAAIAAARVDLT